MDNLIIEKILNMRDIVPLFTGGEQCESLHRFGPHIRDHYLIHFCLSGKGSLTDRYGTHKVSAGELFIIRPGEVTTYVADKDTPWRYVWLGFSGEGASVFSTDRSVYICPKDVLSRMDELVGAQVSSAEAYAALLYELIYRLFSSRQPVRDKLWEIKKYIEYSYMENINAEGVARTFGFERSYLYRMFKRRYGMGVKEYLIKVRMARAAELLGFGYSVYDCAALVGYGDEFNFSRGFKKHFGVSPTEYKKAFKGEGVRQ